ncbi:hypothetical protein AMJ82_12015 [candidate division TA06 bacterium SM23_40]|uniref:Uncharacterized protein n=1 Tax=candidate division TA06 bacterium SM23_40 TaxID=1703774 RepID=A0A0S8FZP6_UNCT6|nr:MAG: hypothetical protein AMJ82_12015 [candidate division TA06 bacterium SM23_40]
MAASDSSRLRVPEAAPGALPEALSRASPGTENGSRVGSCEPESRTPPRGRAASSRDRAARTCRATDARWR